jgi:integrase
VRIRKRRLTHGWVWLVHHRDVDGVRRAPSFATHEEAEDWAQLHVPTRSQRRRRRAVGAPVGLTLGEWAAQWLRQIAPPALKPRAYAAHAAAVARFIVPRLGEVRLTELRRRDVRQLLLWCQARGGADGGGLAPGSVRHVYSAIRALLYAAVDDELLPANPAAKLGGKRGLRLEPTKRERRLWVEQRVLSAEALATLEAATRATRKTAIWYPILLAYSRAGLRLGEAVALELGDFDPVAQGGGTFHVRQTIDHRTGKLGPPKHGPRVVDLTLSPELVTVLRQHVLALKRRVLAQRKPLPRWLFASRAGTPLNPRNVARALGRIALQAGLPRAVSPQDLRHTYATLLLEAGVSVHYVQRQLGHASVQLTVDTYGASARPTLPAGVVGLLDRALSGNRSATDPQQRPAGGA